MSCSQVPAASFVFSNVKLVLSAPVNSKVTSDVILVALMRRVVTKVDVPTNPSTRLIGS